LATKVSESLIALAKDSPVASRPSSVSAWASSEGTEAGRLDDTRAVSRMRDKADEKISKAYVS